MGAEPSPSATEAQGEEAEEYAKVPPPVKDPHGPNVDMRQQTISPTGRSHLADPTDPSSNCPCAKPQRTIEAVP